MTRAVLVLAALVGCREPGTVELPGDTAPLGDTGSATVAPVVVDAAPGTGFQDHAFDHFKRGRGCTVADLDGDDRPDLVLANPDDETYVLLNRSEPGAFSFEPGPVLDDGGLVWSVAAADLDGDDDLDLFLARGGLEGHQADRLLRNEWAETGELSFTDIGDAAGVAGPPSVANPTEPAPLASLTGTWVDFDGDGDLDLHVDTSPWPAFWRPAMPGTQDGRVLLYRNEGDLQFTEIAETVGLTRQASSRFSSWLDADGDGDLDLYENAMRPWLGQLYLDDDDTFTNVTDGVALDGTHIGYPPETFVSASADFNNDGFDDLLLFVRGWPTLGPYQLGHTLLLNVGGQGMVDATEASDLNNPFLAGFRDHASLGVMGATARDVNGDGLPDVFAGNGGPGGGFINGLYVTTGLQTVDFGGDVGELAVPRFESWNHLIDFPSDETIDGAAYPPYPYRTHAGCVADLDGDGRVELAVMNGGMKWVGGNIVREPNRLFTFDTGPAPRFLKIELRGDGATVPYTPVGAHVAVTAARGDDTWTVYDRLRTTEGFAAQHGTVRHVGLSDADRVEKIEVTWPDGEVTVLDDVTLDTTVRIER